MLLWYITDAAYFIGHVATFLIYLLFDDDDFESVSELLMESMYDSTDQRHIARGSIGSFSS